MTIYSEAYRSLRVFPDFAEKAEEYRLKACEIVNRPSLATPADAKWKEFLENPSAPFPGLSYWY
jgi:hypothetical protein